MANPQIGDSEKAPYALTELDAASFPATPAPGDVVSIVSSDPTSLTVTPDATPAAGSIASGFLVGGVPKAGVTVTAGVTHADGTTLPSVVDTFDVVGGAASSLGFAVGTPVPK